jgi:retinol dehydrogenase 12
MSKTLSGKTFLVTGGTEGIGKAAVKRFAEEGATLVLVGRNAEKTQAVVDSLKGLTEVSSILGDCSKVADLKAIAQQFKAKHKRLDVLVNNAGAVFSDYALTSEGFERTFALNHLGYHVLTSQLMDVLKATPGARVVSTSSGAHRTGNIKLETIASRPSKSAGFGAYGDSKLCNILFTRSLAKRLAGTGVVANCFHPGFVRTQFGQSQTNAVTSGFVKFFGPLFGRTPEKGAETLVWLATSPDAAKYTGEYFMDMKPASTSRQAKDDTLAEGLWALSEKLAA